VTTETIAEIRTRAAQARSIAENLHNRRAQVELQEIAEALEAEAAKLEEAARRNKD
jgi:hypothetical protein